MPAAEQDETRSARRDLPILVMLGALVLQRFEIFVLTGVAPAPRANPELPITRAASELEAR